MKSSRFWRQIAQILRRFKFIMVIVQFVMRLLQPRVTVGVVGLVYNNKNEILLVEHVFHAETPWGLPGGWIGAKEPPEECVKREIMEELHLEIDVIDILLVERTLKNHLDFAYLCRPKGKVGELSFELLDYAWYDPENIPPLVKFHHHAIAKFLDLQPIQEN